MKDPAAGKSYKEWVKYWGSRANPWRFGRKDQRLPANIPEINPTEMVTDGKGNVLYMPLLVGVPCFGAPVVNRRFSGTRYWDRTRGRWQSYRCTDCGAKAACNKLVLERISCHPDMVSWAKEYRSLQRKRSNAGENEPSNMERRALGFFVRAVMDYGQFENSNDEASQIASDVIADAVRRSDTDRKRKAYRHKFRRGKVPKEALAAAAMERDSRATRTIAYARSSSAPTRLKRVDENSIRMTAEVWYSRLTLSWSKKSCGPADIARDLTARGCHQGKSHEALRTRISKTDFRRISDFETGNWPLMDGPLWSPFEDWMTPPE